MRVVAVFVVLAVGTHFFLHQWSNSPLQIIKNGVSISFPRNTPLEKLASDLEAQGLVSHAWMYRLFVRLYDDYQSFQAGHYLFSVKVTPREIGEKIRRGKAHFPDVFQVVIPEGFTLKKVIDRLAARGVGSQSDLARLLHRQSFIDELGIHAKSLEGYLYPATYRFRAGMGGEAMISQMVKTFWQRLPQNFVERLQKERRLTLHQGVTFASLIELETRHQDEKPKVAEVIWRRLRAGEPLAIDAALIYGIEDYGGDIKWSHLKDRSNKYNTRIHKGLPPGPIGSPTTSSFEAVLNPSNKGYYYYVLKPDGTGRHHFSASLSEHNRHVKLLIRNSKKRSRRPMKD